MDNKRQNFIRISWNRVQKILTLLNQLTNLTNTSFYEYTNEDIEKIFAEIESETSKAKMRLLSSKKNTKKTEL